jgi:hypothetical protein
VITAIFQFISNLFGATGKVAGAVQQRDAEKNTVDQRTNAEAAQIQADRDRARKAINSGDDDDLSKQVAP